jgi:hypothetical protein
MKRNGEKKESEGINEHALLCGEQKQFPPFKVPSQRPLVLLAQVRLTEGKTSGS